MYIQYRPLNTTDISIQKIDQSNACLKETEPLSFCFSKKKSKIRANTTMKKKAVQSHSGVEGSMYY
jgi:hypothetical protein